MNVQRSWPSRFRVTVQTNSGQEITYMVVTWLYREKALAIAVAAHVTRHNPGLGPMAIRDLEVEELGPVGRTSRGTTRIEPDDVVDRMEF